MENPVDSLDSILKRRHSGRSYDSERKVTKEQLFIMAEAGRIAPSCYNDQPWFFIFTSKDSEPKSYEKVLSSLDESNQKWAKNAPVLIVVLGGSRFHKNEKENRWGIFDTGAAAYSMMLQAVKMDLMTHQMGGFNQEIIRKEFQIPSEVTPMSVMALGYEKKGEPIPPKDRLPMNNNFFWSEWNKPLK